MVTGPLCMLLPFYTGFLMIFVFILVAIFRGQSLKLEMMLFKLMGRFELPGKVGRGSPQCHAKAVPAFCWVLCQVPILRWLSLSPDGPMYSPAC